jgi:hypothetical protein
MSTGVRFGLGLRCGDEVEGFLHSFQVASISEPGMFTTVFSLAAAQEHLLC